MKVIGRIENRTGKGAAGHQVIKLDFVVCVRLLLMFDSSRPIIV